jgi:hypothetical protein
MTFKKLETILSYKAILADIVVIYAKILPLLKLALFTTISVGKKNRKCFNNPGKN